MDSCRPGACLHPHTCLPPDGCSLFSTHGCPVTAECQPLVGSSALQSRRQSRQCSLPASSNRDGKVSEPVFIFLMVVEYIPLIFVFSMVPCEGAPQRFSMLQHTPVSILRAHSSCHQHLPEPYISMRVHGLTVFDCGFYMVPSLGLECGVHTPSP